MKKLGALLVLGLWASCADIDLALANRLDAGIPGGGGEGGGAPGGGSATGGGGATGGGTANGNFVDGGACFEGTCWENPIPQGNNLKAVWGVNANEVWMVGDVGTALRWTPAGWESHPLPRTEELRSVWATGRHVWVVGTVGVNDMANVMQPMHFDGVTWNVEAWSGPADPQLISVRGRDENEVWASGNLGVIAERGSAGNWSGRLLEQVAGSGLNVFLPAIALDTDGHCVVAIQGELRGIARCDGGGLELSLDASYEVSNNGLWSTGPGVFRGALTRTDPDGGSLTGELWLRTDGGWRSDYDSAPSAATCTAGSENNGFNVAYCNGRVLEGSPPQNFNHAAGIDTNLVLFGMWTPGALEGSWLVGQSGAQYRYQNNQWQQQQRGSTEVVFSLWVDSQRVLGAGSNSSAFTRNADSSWSRTALRNGLGETRDLWISPDGGYRAYVGVDRMLLEGAGLSTLAQAAGVTPNTSGDLQLNGLWGTASTNLWAVGNQGEVWHRGAARWERSSLFPDGGPQLRDLDGTDEGNAFMIGAGCVVLRRDPAADGGWVDDLPGCTDELYGVWAAPANDAGLEAVAVGANGAALFRRNGLWANDNPPDAPSLYKVWGTSAFDIWAVGDLGTLQHFDRNGWTRIETGTRWRLDAVRGRRLDGGELELFVAGENGTILRRLVR